MTLSRLKLVATLSLAAGWAPPRIAQACSPPACEGGLLAPGDTTSIPANQTALVVTAAWSNAAPSVEPKPGSTLRLEADGMPVPFSLKKVGVGPDWFITPDRLSAGTAYTLSYAYDCDGAPRTAISKFSVGAAVPVPTTAGALKSDGAGVRGEDKAQSPGDCTIDYRHAFSSFAFVPSAEFLPYLAVSRIIAEVDGKPWSEAPYGSVSTKEIPTIELIARCKPASGADPSELALGKHALKVTVEIAGGPTLTVPEQEVVLSCADSPAGKDGGAPPPNGAETGDGGTSVATTDSGCGCSLGSRASGGGASMAVMLALSVLAVMRRRVRGR